MKQLKQVTLFLILIVSLLGCEKNEKDKFSYYGRLEGTIKGYNYFSTDSEQLIKDAEILFDRGDVSFVDFADENGAFSFDDIPYGSYNVTVSHALYSPQYKLGYQLYFTDSIRNLSFNLHKQSSITEFYSAEIEKNEDNWYFVWMGCNGDLNDRLVYVIFFSEDENVSYKNYQFMSGSLNWKPDQSSGTYDLLQGHSDIYFAIYPVCGFQSWIEPETREKFSIEFNPKVEYIGHYEE